MELPCFGDLKKMAEDDPDALEELRKAYVRGVIDSAPPEKRKLLERLQWKIDQRVALSSNPMHATIELSRMMNDSFQDLRSLLNELAGNGPTQDKTKTKGSVLKLKRK